MHGDLGLHNILFNGDQIAGIIDPETVIGDRIYDFISFVFSDLRICENLKIQELYKLLGQEPQEKIKAMVILVLFERIIRCVRNNIPNIEKYIKLWNYFSNMLAK